jgi:hypothetical protein
VQPVKELLPISSKESDAGVVKSIPVKLVQPLKALKSIYSSCSGKLIDFKPIHPSKALVKISITESGIKSIEVKFAQS